MICHQTERPFICEKSGNTFKSKDLDTLDRHTKITHQKEKACDHCGKLFETKRQLENIQNNYTSITNDLIPSVRTLKCSKRDQNIIL